MCVGPYYVPSTIILSESLKGRIESTLTDLSCFQQKEPFVPFFLIFIFERERKRQSASGGGTERERETQNRKQAPGSELSAQSPTWGSNP